jgi:hypothetical protein
VDGCGSNEKDRGEDVYEYTCHEGNYDVMTTILAGARVEEKAAEEAARRPK